MSGKLTQKSIHQLCKTNVNMSLVHVGGQRRENWFGLFDSTLKLKIQFHFSYVCFNPTWHVSLRVG